MGEQRSKKIVVIGGGVSGMNAVVMLKEEGFEPIAFDKTDKIGGTWCYRDQTEVGVASIMPTTTINNSKEMSAISNHPPRKERSNFMKHSEFYEYLKDYAEANDVERHYKLNTEVTSVRRAEDYEETGKWSVSVKDRITGAESTDIYDGVVVCTGHINRPKMVTYPGLDTFKGKVVHTHSLKGVSEYEGQNVVVVGMGCSALDAAVDTSSVAKQVYLSTRSGADVFNRVCSKGYPFDYYIVRRYLLTLLDILPTQLCSWYVKRAYMDPVFDSNLYFVKSDHHLLGKDPVINDHLFSKLMSGTIIQKRNIAQVTDSGVIFDSEKEVTPVDTIIMATGYTWGFPILEDGIIQVQDGVINLYKCIFPPHFKHPTLAVMGFFLPFGPGIPLVEMQCRWMARVFAGKAKLPSEKVMMQEIVNRHISNSARFAPSEKMTIRVDYMQYLDNMANEIGAKPNFFKMLFTDPVLFYKLWFGPHLSYQYRLEGPHKWEGARDAIMSVDDRIVYPLKRYSETSSREIILNYLKSWLTTKWK